jgi:hypothetical protein
MIPQQFAAGIYIIACNEFHLHVFAHVIWRRYKSFMASTEATPFKNITAVGA